MSIPELHTALTVMLETARKTGSYTLDNFERRNEVDQRFAHDVKLRLDRECQDLIESELQKAFPGIGVYGEEGHVEGEHTAARWIVDPIDGTVNFSRGLPNWGHSIALEVDDRVVAGVFYMPELDWLFSASADTPALLNDNPIHNAETQDLKDAMVLTGLPKHKQVHDAHLGLYDRLAMRTMKTRVMGSAASDICMVACGRADIYFESCIHLWDVAAAGFIARKAGARTKVHSTSGEQLRYLCAVPALFDDVLALMDECFSR